MIFRYRFILSSAHFYLYLDKNDVKPQKKRFLRLILRYFLYMPKTPSKPAAKKKPAKTSAKAKASPKIKEEKVSVVKEKDTTAKVLKADELLG